LALGRVGGIVGLTNAGILRKPQGLARMCRNGSTMPGNQARVGAVNLGKETQRRNRNVYLGKFSALMLCLIPGISAVAMDVQCEETPEHVRKWENSWKNYNGKPGFHMKTPNPCLLEYGELLFDNAHEHQKILVPLCGKTVDLILLQEMGDVCGIEVVQTAIDQFAEENQVTWSTEDLLQSAVTKFVSLKATVGNTLMIAKQDLFNLPKGWSSHSNSKSDGKFTCCWDRASLVAIAPELREKYVQVLLEELAPDATILMQVITYNKDQMQGPPYPVTPGDVEKLYGEHFDIELLDWKNITSKHERWKKNNPALTNIFESTYLLRRKQ